VANVNLGFFQATVGTSSAAISANTDAIQYGTTLKALSTNTASIFAQVGTVAAVAAAGWELAPGDTLLVPTSQAATLASISAISTAVAQTLCVSVK
jgi:hypothetical protein